MPDAACKYSIARLQRELGVDRLTLAKLLADLAARLVAGTLAAGHGVYIPDEVKAARLILEAAIDEVRDEQEPTK